MRRELLKDVGRIVVKFGTGVLTDSRKQPDLAQMEQLVRQVAELRKQGREVLLVSSGAVGAGMGVLGHAKRPAELSELQACAAVGQPRLMGIYEDLFRAHDLSVAQILLTHADLEHHERHLNARNTLVSLLRLGVVPSSTKTTSSLSPSLNLVTTTNSPPSWHRCSLPTCSSSSRRWTA